MHAARWPTLSVELCHHRRRRVPGARHQPADPQAHQIHVLDQRVLPADHRRGADPPGPDLPRRRRAAVLDYIPHRQAALPAARLDAARGRAQAALKAPQGHRVDRQMVDARRAGAGADDLLPQEPGGVRRGQPAGGLLLHRLRRADDPLLCLAEDGSCRRQRHGPRAGGAQTPVGGAQLPALVPHHRGDGVLRPRHHPAGDPLHHRLRVDQRALDRDHHLGAVREQRILPVCGGLRRVDLLPVPQAVLLADARHLARPVSGVPPPLDLDHGMARALLDDRRHGAGADDLLRELLGLHRGRGDARRLLLRSFRADHHAGVRLGQHRSLAAGRARRRTSCVANRDGAARAAPSSRCRPIRDAGTGR